MLKCIEQSALEEREVFSSDGSFVLQFDDWTESLAPIPQETEVLVLWKIVFYERHLRSRTTTCLTMFSKHCPPPLLFSITSSKRSDSGLKKIRFQSRKGSTGRTDIAEIAEDDQVRVQIAASKSRMVLNLIVQSQL